MLDKIVKAKRYGVLGFKIAAAVSRHKYKKADPEFHEKLGLMQGQCLRAHIYRNLKKKYKKEIKSLKEKIISEDMVLPHDHDKIIWIMWLQGIENAPEIVRMCYRSISDNFSNEYKIIALNEQNVNDYVTLPEYIVQKYKKGIISKQHYSDLVRLELLDKYGGTWMDATIFCSGGTVPKYMLDDDLFLFRMLWYATWGMATVMNSFFISACKNNKIIKLTKELFFDYWKKNNDVADYWLIDDFFEIAIEEFADDWKKTIPVECLTMHVLQTYLTKPYDERVFSATISRMPFHKLTWKLDKEDMEKEGTLYKYLLSHYPVYEPKTE